MGRRHPGDHADRLETPRPGHVHGSRAPLSRSLCRNLERDRSRWGNVRENIAPTLTAEQREEERSWYNICCSDGSCCRRWRAWSLPSAEAKTEAIRIFG